MSLQSVHFFVLSRDDLGCLCFDVEIIGRILPILQGIFMNNSSFFGNRLKEERKKLKMTQAEIAEKCGVSGRMWGDYERGISQPKAELFFQFEKVGIDVQYVMHGRRGETAVMPSETLNAEEQELLVLFREAAAADREMILMVARRAEKKAQTALGKVSNG
ncbi:TPA: helix-turn-helix transcriptional regulator [Neisseria meningitidis]|jgi:Predicted transcriptional regulators|nr:helix-turn-helix transcriptional regulator [Neisseria meningitidis]MCL4984946.1 helix-turn-helix transcriptional regulator [Neisseria meningitidis]MCL4990994.1 helix-turn-helix transcriptional regulator [Neisseria meningitidis]MCL4999233.1 helix-turn-helix transcriptional regulator [Neisseria meningitidis]MCL5001060.1 helix-turn-helix transcriptional regulator [Neisseria meningitidis]MCL5684919.1 helix-turn-helix transcriptional regulator [Neisseria meningitidis]